MFEESTAYTFDTFSNSSEGIPNASFEPSGKVAQPSLEVRARSAVEIATEYKVSDKTVQTWFKAVLAAYCWLDPEILRTGSGKKVRYTPFVPRVDCSVPSYCI